VEAAAITAAHAVLTHLVPDEKKMLDAALTTTLANVADGAAKDAGAAVGRVAAKLFDSGATTGSMPRSRTRRALRPAPGGR
jgi:hypothetical protein